MERFPFLYSWALASVESDYLHLFSPWGRRQWHPTPVLLPGKSHGWMSLHGVHGVWSLGSRRVRHDWATSLSLFTFMHWRRKWQLTPVFLPGESQDREPVGLPSMGSHRVGHDWCDLAAAAAHDIYQGTAIFTQVQRAL